MGFLVPAFLAGLAAIIVPVILHLRHRDRDTPHRFPSLMFIERLPIRTAQRRRITDWPLLLLRALAIMLLVLAFARPLWSRPRALGVPVERTVVVLLDRSMSMGHRGVWPAAVDSARRVIAALAPSDRVALIVFDDQADIVQPLTGDHALALAALDKARPGTAGTRYVAALRAARQLVADAHTGTAPVDVVLVSDVQRAGTPGLAGLSLPATMHVRVAPVSTGTRTNASVTVTEARPLVRSDRQMLAVSAHVASRGLAAARQMTATLRLNGRPSGTRVVSVAGTGETKIAFEPVPLPSGLVRGEVTIDPDSLAADDSARFALTSDDAVRVLIAAPDDADRDETLYLERALAVGSAPAVRVQRVRPNGLDAKMLDVAALVLLWDTPLPAGSAGSALASWTRRGGGLVMVAGRRLGRRRVSADILPASTNGMAERRDDRGGSLGDVRLDHPLFAPFRQTPAALVAPRFVRHTRLEPAHGGDVIARFDDGSAAVLERAEGTGHVLMIAAPMDARAGDFPLQPAYVPFVRRLVMYSTGRDAMPLARETGETWIIPASTREPVVSTPDGSIARPVRDARGATLPLRDAGVYLLHDGEVRGPAVRQLAVNTPASESNLSAMSPDELLGGITHGDATAVAATQVVAPADVERRQGFWRLLIAALTLLLLLEMLMANRGWRGAANPLTTAPPTGAGS